MNIHFIIKHIHPTIYDPLNLPGRTVPDNRFSYDPIHPDAAEIIERLLDATTEAQTKAIIFEYFGKYFGADIIGEEWETLKDGVLDLWRYCTK